ncbi:hypothetical protein D3C79_913240 [compost metagenome]
MRGAKARPAKAWRAVLDHPGLRVTQAESQLDKVRRRLPADLDQPATHCQLPVIEGRRLAQARVGQFHDPFPVRYQLAHGVRLALGQQVRHPQILAGQLLGGGSQQRINLRVKLTVPGRARGQ